jgi:hypothetical protein
MTSASFKSGEFAISSTNDWNRAATAGDTALNAARGIARR